MEHLRFVVERDADNWRWYAYGPENTQVASSPRAYARKEDCEDAVARAENSEEIAVLACRYHEALESAERRRPGDDEPLLRVRRAKRVLKEALEAHG